MGKVEEILNKAEEKTAEQKDKSVEENGAKDKEVLSKEQQLTNLNRAIDEANVKLKAARTGKTVVEPEEKIPEIDMEDPSSKAWDRHIRSKVEPLAKEVEQEKSEIFDSAIKEFLSDKPDAQRSPEKIQELVETYETLSAGKISGRTKEGVTQYLSKAFAAVNNDSLIDAARSSSVDRARLKDLFASPAVDGGTTGYQNERSRIPNLSDEDRDYIRRMGYGSVEEWAKDREKK